MTRPPVTDPEMIAQWCIPHFSRMERVIVLKAIETEYEALALAFGEELPPDGQSSTVEELARIVVLAAKRALKLSVIREVKR